MIRIAFTAAALLSAPVLADTHIAYVNAGGQAADQIYIKSGMVRMESGAGHSIGIFDTVSNALIVVNPDKKTYSIFNEQTAANLGTQFQEAQQRLQEATGKLQKQAESLADKATTLTQHGLLQTLVGHALIDYAVTLMIPSNITLQMELKDLGTEETVAGFKCQNEQLLINGKPGDTRCVVRDTAALGIPAADLATLQTMSDDYKQILTAIEPMAPGISATMPTGLPVRSQKLAWDPATQKLTTATNTLQSISTGPLSTDLFKPPAGYTQTSLDQIGR